MELLPYNLIVSGLGLTIILVLAMIFLWWRNMEHDFIGMNENAIVFKRTGPFSTDLILGSDTIKTIYMDCNAAGDIKGFGIQAGWMTYTIPPGDVDFFQMKDFAQTNRILFIKRYPLGAGEIEKVIYDPQDPFY